MSLVISRAALIGGLFLSLACVNALAADDLNGLDANHDGQVGREEAQAAQKNNFASLDSNHNGSLSAPEFAAAQPALSDSAKPAARNRQQVVIKRWFANMDGDDNGGVSEAEYLSAVRPYFDRLDDDHNGVLDPDELQKAVGKP